VVAANTGAGQRTTAVAMRRQPRSWRSLGVSQPNRLTTQPTPGPAFSGGRQHNQQTNRAWLAEVWK